MSTETKAAEPTDAELASRLGLHSGDVLDHETSRVGALFRALRSSIRDAILASMVDGWQWACSAAMVNAAPVAKLRAILRLEAQIADFPALAKSEVERVDAANVAARERAQREAPAATLAALRLAGLSMALDITGKHIVMSPADAAKLAPHDVEAVRQHKAAILAMLHAEAEAARPLVIA